MKNKDNINKQLDDFLDDVLKTAPDCSLSSDFAEKITKKVYQTFVWKRYLSEFFIAISLALVTVAAGLGVLFLIEDNNYFDNIINIIITYKTIIVSILVFIIFISFFNYVILNYMFFYYKKKLINR